jgi:hypothetical protein
VPEPRHSLRLSFSLIETERALEVVEIYQRAGDVAPEFHGHDQFCEQLITAIPLKNARRASQWKDQVGNGIAVSLSAGGSRNVYPSWNFLAVSTFPCSERSSTIAVA